MITTNAAADLILTHRYGEEVVIPTTPKRLSELETIRSHRDSFQRQLGLIADQIFRIARSIGLWNLKVRAYRNPVYRDPVNGSQLVMNVVTISGIPTPDMFVAALKLDDSLTSMLRAITNDSNYTLKGKTDSSSVILSYYTYERNDEHEDATSLLADQSDEPEDDSASYGDLGEDTARGRDYLQKLLGQIVESVSRIARSIGWRHLKVRSYRQPLPNSVIVQNVVTISGVPTPKTLVAALEFDDKLTNALHIISNDYTIRVGTDPSSVTIRYFTYDVEDDYGTPSLGDHSDEIEGSTTSYGDLSEDAAHGLEAIKTWLSRLVGNLAENISIELRRYGWRNVHVNQYVKDDHDRHRAVIAVQGVPSPQAFIDLVNSCTAIGEQIQSLIGQSEDGTIRYRRTGPNSFLIVMEMSVAKSALVEGSHRIF
jgi:hypothetical protein